MIYTLKKPNVYYPEREMKIITKYFKTFLPISVLVILYCSQEKVPALKGLYPGQNLPGNTPEVFAPGIVSTGMSESCPAFTPDGKEFFFTVFINGVIAIVSIREENGKWTTPEVASFSGKYKDAYPSVHPDGSKLFFISDRSLNNNSGSGAKYNIWCVEKQRGGWGEAKPIGSPVNSDISVSGPSVTRDGTIYFTKMYENFQGIYRSKYVNGRYLEPEKLPDNVNTVKSQFDSYIAPDESFLFIPVYGREDSRGSTDIYVSFRDKNDNWSDVINLGDKINTGRTEASMTLTPDGKYFLFQTEADKYKGFDTPLTYSGFKEMYNNPCNGNSDIYWVDAKFIEELRPEGF